MTIPEIDAAQFASEVIAGQRLVLVEFFTPPCGLCIQMLPMLAEVAAERSNRLKVVKCNAEENAEFAARFRINAVPSLILFRKGEPIGQRVGRITKRDVLAWVDNAVSIGEAQSRLPTLAFDVCPRTPSFHLVCLSLSIALPTNVTQ